MRLSLWTHSHPSRTWLTANHQNSPSLTTRWPVCKSGIRNSTPGASPPVVLAGPKQEPDFHQTLGQGQSSMWNHRILLSSPTRCTEHPRHYNHWEINWGRNESTMVVSTAPKKHFVEQDDVMPQRLTFFNCTQKLVESVADFETRIRSTARKTKYRMQRWLTLYKN